MVRKDSPEKRVEKLRKKAFLSAGKTPVSLICAPMGKAQAITLQRCVT
jgi:hypothetical protein